MLFKNSTKLLIAPLTFTLSNAAAAATIDCDAVIEDTLIEMKAGAGDWWDADNARMAGMAAASACFKAKAISSSPDHDSYDGHVDATEETSDFMGLQVKPLNGPPSKKPFERRERN